MSEWVLFMHPPRDDFIATVTGAERSAFDAHARWLRKLLADGVLIVAGPCLGQVNTGIAIFEHPMRTRHGASLPMSPSRAAGTCAGTCGRTGSACCAAVTASRSEAVMKTGPVALH